MRQIMGLVEWSLMKIPIFRTFFTENINFWESLAKNFIHRASDVAGLKNPAKTRHQIEPKPYYENPTKTLGIKTAILVKKPIFLAKNDVIF